MDFVGHLMNLLVLSVAFALEYERNHDGCWQKIKAMKFTPFAENVFINGMYLDEHKSCLYRYVQGYGSVAEDPENGLSFEEAGKVCTKYRGRRLRITDESMLQSIDTVLAPLIDGHHKNDYLWTDAELMSVQGDGENSMVVMSAGSNRFMAKNPYIDNVLARWCNANARCGGAAVVVGSYNPGPKRDKFQWQLGRTLNGLIPNIGFRPDGYTRRDNSKPFARPIVQGVICEVVTCAKKPVGAGEASVGVSDLGDGEKPNDGLSFAGQVAEIGCKGGYKTQVRPSSYQMTCGWDGEWTGAGLPYSLKCVPNTTIFTVPTTRRTNVPTNAPLANTVPVKQSDTPGGAVALTEENKTGTVVYILAVLGALGVIVIIILALVGSAHAHKKRKRHHHSKHSHSPTGSKTSVSAQPEQP